MISVVLHSSTVVYFTNKPNVTDISDLTGIDISDLTAIDISDLTAIDISEII